jgi:putative flavoprotein involved in K+ transport
MERTGTVVVGAGPAGLAMSSALAAVGAEHVVLERGRVGESWRSQRWDSFRLNTPNWMNGLEGDPHAFSGARELVAALERRAAALPVRSGVEVLSARRAGGGWRVETSSGVLRADHVVAASGAQSSPDPPPLAAQLPAKVEQLHAGDYRSPGDLPDGPVLVVGGAQTGLQLAEELAEAGRRVHLATSRVGRMPRRYRGRDVTEWWSEMGLYARRPEDVPASVRRAHPPQVSGTRGGHTLSLQSLARAGVVLHGRLEAIVTGSRAWFAADLFANVAYADAESARIRREIDRHIALRGLSAPAAVPDPAEAPLVRIEDPGPIVLGRDVRTVIWAGGFGDSFGWLRGDAPKLGVPWLRTRASAILFGMPDDARALTAALTRRVAA